MYRIEAVRAGHDRKSFDCGHPFLNTYLAQFARQNSDSGVAKAYVMVPDGKPGPVAGYYTLAASAVAYEHFPEPARRRLPKYPVPVARLGELAVDKNMQGEGFGTALLVNALRRVSSASREMGVWAIVVDPIDSHAATFYLRHGFEPLLTGIEMFLTIKDAKGWLAKSASHIRA
jgi:GNAT superfamily N-acetyltransferase